LLEELSSYSRLEIRALFEKITTSKRESEEYDAKENSLATKIDPLT
jgi:hypothetical protein